MKRNGKWQIKETKEKFANEFFKVLEDKVVKPDGRNGKYATVEFVAGVTILPIDDDGFVYLTKQFRYKAGRETLEAVAGAIENETPMRAAKRELKEELGITAQNFFKVGKIQLDNSIIHSETTQYIARQLNFSQPDRDSEEEMKVVRLQLHEAVQKVLNGEITHAPSCVLILKAEKIMVNGKW